LPPFCFPAYFSCLFSLGVLWVWLQCSGTAWWSMNSTESGKCCTKSFPTSSSFWERSYDCRPCITEVGMITPCSRTFHTGLQYFEPTLLAVISEFELQRSWNQISCCHLRIWASEELKLHLLPKKLPILRLQKYLRGRGATFTRIEGRVVWVSRVSGRLC
jgi:hypothetical protein